MDREVLTSAMSYHIDWLIGGSLTYQRDFKVTGFWFACPLARSEIRLNKLD